MRVVVIGGSAAGLKAACRIKRLQPETKVTVLEKGEYFGYSACSMPYFVSGDISDYYQLISTSHGVVKDVNWYKDVKGVEISTNHEVQSIDRVQHMVEVFPTNSSKRHNIPYDKLVIATGTAPTTPAPLNIECDRVLHFTRPEDAISLHRSLSTGQLGSVAIIGGGFIGLELCEAFASLWGAEVHLIEMLPHVLSPGYDTEISQKAEAELLRNDVKLHLNSRCEHVDEKEDKLCVTCSDGSKLEVDRIVVATGVKPAVGLAKSAGLEIGVSGCIKVNPNMQTSDPDIYAAGDCVELLAAADDEPGNWALGSLANRTGRITGDNICGITSKMPPLAGANIFKLFDLTIGSVGLSENECNQKNLKASAIWGTFYDRVHSYPEAQKMNLKLVYDDSNGKLLGLQAVGSDSVQHILDKMSILIQHDVVLNDLQDLEQVYSPPYSQPFDPLHYLAFIAANSEREGIELVSPLKFGELSEDAIILDVRTTSEISSEPLPTVPQTAIQIPLEALRDRLAELPTDKPITVVCQMGSRSWDAALMLKHAGCKSISFLAGGVLFLTRDSVGIN